MWLRPGLAEASRTSLAPALADTFAADSSWFSRLLALCTVLRSVFRRASADPAALGSEHSLLQAGLLSKGSGLYLKGRNPHLIIVSEPSSREAWLRICHFGDAGGDPVSSLSLLPPDGGPSAAPFRAAVDRALGVPRNFQVYSRRLSPTFCRRPVGPDIWLQFTRLALQWISPSCLD